MVEGSLIPRERVEGSILLMRRQKVIIDETLARLYGVTTSRLNEQMKRNSERFPSDFVFQLTESEHASLRSHSAILKKGRGQHRKFLPYAYTEHGALMVASVLNSPKAIEMSIVIVRTFVRLRHIFASHRRLAERLDELERKQLQNDQRFVSLFDAIRQLGAPPSKPQRRIGFAKPSAETAKGTPSDRTITSST
jgi:hypothetical protein